MELAQTAITQNGGTHTRTTGTRKSQLPNHWHSAHCLIFLIIAIVNRLTYSVLF